MESVAVLAVVMGMLAAGGALFAAVAMVMRARARRFGSRPERGVRHLGGLQEPENDWVYLPWRRVRPHYFGGAHHGEHHPGGHDPGGHDGSSWHPGIGGSDGGGGHHHG